VANHHRAAGVGIWRHAAGQDLLVLGQAQSGIIRPVGHARDVVRGCGRPVGGLVVPYGRPVARSAPIMSMEGAARRCAPADALPRLAMSDEVGREFGSCQLLARLKQTSPPGKRGSRYAAGPIVTHLTAACFKPCRDDRTASGVHHDAIKRAGKGARSRGDRHGA